MGKYLITGRGGTGKSSVCAMLESRDYNAVDSDTVLGLARSEDKNGKPINIDWSHFVDYETVAFNWQPAVLRRLLTVNQNVFLCGSASNQLEFHDLFDKVFVLTLTPETHRNRLQHRDSEYGKDPTMQAYLLEEQQRFVRQALTIGAIAINTEGTIEQTADAILEQIDDLRTMAIQRG